MNKTALAPCPFCGSSNVAQGASREFISVWCFCGARGPDVPFPDNCIDPATPIQKCYEAWNRRSPAPAPAETEEDRALANFDKIKDSFFASNDAVLSASAKGVTDEMVERACEIAGSHLEADMDGDEPFVRNDSIETAMHAVLSALLPSGRETGRPDMIDWERIARAQSRKLHHVLNVPGVKDALKELNWADAGDAVDHNRRIRSALLPSESAEKAGVVGWRDISSAPKDGTDIILAAVDRTYNGKPVPDRVTIGHWTTNEECRVDIGDCGGDCHCREYEYVDPMWISWDGSFTAEDPPTHWTPLPAAPASPSPALECHGLDTPERVCFYEQDFYVLSNFSSFRIEWKGRWFDTSEHAYHWEKFHNAPGTQVAIRTTKSAHDAFKIAEQRKAERRPDWDAVKVGIMRDIIRAKAAQHEYVRRKLLATGDRELVENSWRDDYWGWGPNRDGKNMLGKLWMEIRAELRASPSPATGGA